MRETQRLTTTASDVKDPPSASMRPMARLERPKRDVVSNCCNEVRLEAHLTNKLVKVAESAGSASGGLDCLDVGLVESGKSGELLQASRVDVNLWT